MGTINMQDDKQTSRAPLFSIRRVFLVLLIGSLSIVALITIFIFLTGDFDSFDYIEINVLLTSLIIGGYSLTGLCSSALCTNKRYVVLAFSGIVISVLGSLITVGTVWEIIFDFDDTWQSIIVFAILAFSIAHSSLLLLARSDKILVNASLNATIAFITIFALMLIYLVFQGNHLDDVDEFYYRLLAVFAILDVLGTIVTPLLKKFYSGTGK